MAVGRFTESIVEEAALAWFEQLGYEVFHGPDIAPGQQLAERDDYRDVVLTGRLRDALARINPEASPEARDEALRRVVQAQQPSLVLANRAFHRLLVDGVFVEVLREGEKRGERVALVDFDNPRKNDWLVVNQDTVVEGRVERRPDVVVFVNGIPLAVVELKNTADEGATIDHAYNQLQTYQAQIPRLFQTNELLVISDGNETRIGCVTTPRERFAAWKTIDGDELLPSASLEVTIKGVFEPRRFLVWAPKCMAMIGKLPDTLEDRALVVHLRRKQEGETVERFRADRLHEFLHLRRKAARWAEDNALRLRDMDPMVPQELNDRAQDNARAICAIADAAGGAWPKAIRDALVGAAAQVDDEPQSAGVLLLRDVAEVFDAKGIASISSTGLCTALCELEESPWNEWRGGRPISTRGIAKLLKPYGIEPKRDRHHRYYRRMDFTDAFKRYLSEGVKNSVTSYTSVMPGHNLLEKNGNPYDAYSSRDTCKRHTTDADQEWEGEI